MESETKARLLAPISDEVIEAIRQEISNTHVTGQTTELEAGFMLGIQHALAAMERHKNGGVA